MDPKTNLRSEIVFENFGFKKLFGQKIFGFAQILGLKYYGSKKILGHKKNFSPKKF